MEVKKDGSVMATFVYDGDGRQVKATINGETTTYVGSHYEVKGSVVTKYYFAGSIRIAMRENGALSYLLGDHLGSSSVTTDASGVSTATMLYKAWGETRYSSGATATSYRYTGQREEVSFGLYFYNARWMDPQLGRFVQADNIIPDGIQGFDRYAYASNSPVRYSDPTGHFTDDQLEDWYGKDWKDLFSPIMIAFLREAQMGDVLLGQEISLMFVEDQDGNLSFWNLQSKSLESISTYNNIDSETTALYRPTTAGEEPTPTRWRPDGPGEGIGKPWYSNPLYRKVYDLGCNDCSETYQLPDKWYQGDNGTYIDVVGGPAGINPDWLDILGIGTGGFSAGRTVVTKGPLAGGFWGGVLVLGASVLSILEWDTGYGARSGHIAPVPQGGVPTPPISPSP